MTLLALASVLAYLAAASIELPPAPTAAQEPTPVEDAACTLHGVLVDELGDPVSGATIAVQGWQSNSDRARQFGVPKSWQNPTPVTSGEDGRFSVSFVPPRAYQFTLDTTKAGYGGISWRWSQVAPGADLDLGTTVIEREGVLVGYIVDGQGALLVEGWRVSAFSNWGAGAGDRSTLGAHSTVDPDTGAFRIEGLPPGKLRVSASSGSVRIPDTSVTTKPGEETSVELRYTGPDPRRKLVVSISTRPFYPFRPDAGTVHAIAADGTRTALVQEPGRANDWYVPDIAPGTYRVEIRDPRFVDWTQEVRPGQAAQARLEGNAALRVSVVDDATGAVVPSFALDVAYRDVNFSPSVFRVREADASAPPGDLYRGIVPGDLTIEVLADGWPKATVAVDALAPHETRDVEVRLMGATSLRGRVVDASGAPLAGVEVEVTRGDVPGHSSESGGVRSMSGSFAGKAGPIKIPPRDAVAVTAADGTFTFEGLGAGPHTLFAPLGLFAAASAHADLPTVAPVELIAPPWVAVSVHMLVPDDQDVNELSLSPSFRVPGEFAPLRVALRDFGWQLWRPNSEGVFPAERLPAGKHPFFVNRATTDRFGSGYNGVMRVELDFSTPGRITLDLRERFPVRTVVYAHLPTEGRPMLLFHLVAADGAAQQFDTDYAASERGVRNMTDIAPGTYTLRLTGPALEWSSPTPFVVARGARNEHQLEVPVIGRTVRVLDAEGAPRANALVAYWSDPGRRACAETDASGELKLVLLEGPLSMALLPPVDPADERVQAARRLGNPPPVDPEVLEAAVAGATTAFQAGEGTLELRLR
ncbi:MAG: carboxypeptidase regulatory-like domain-containing protein [Planctomycetota bacterium]